MIKVILLLASLESTVKKETKGKGQGKKPPEQNHRIVEREYDQLIAETEPYKRALPERPKFGKRVQAGVKNIGNVVRNVYSNTFGKGIAKYQDYRTDRHFKKNPESQDKIVYKMEGFGQNIGASIKYFRQLRKRGMRGRHIKASSNLSGKEGRDESFGQIYKFQKKTGLKDPYKRRDYLEGHSSGGNRAIEMACDERIKQYGIKKVHPIAPTPTGIRPKTLGQKLLIPLAGKEDVRYYEGKRAALELSSKKPYVPVHVTVGEHDALVPPKDAAYKHAEVHNVIEGPDSTHFGMSGSNTQINELLIDILKREPVRYKRKEKQVLQRQEKGAERYYQATA